jgi:acetate kinase
MDNKYILVINAGSSTLKFKVFKLPNFNLVREGIVERIGLLNSFIKIGDKKEVSEVENHDQAFKLLSVRLTDLANDIIIVGHRFVHGGEEFTKPALVTRPLLQRLRKYNQLAPLHNPVSLSCIKASQKYLKQAKDIVVFDTAFFRTLPDYAYIYALPLKYYTQYKIRRYGFHGISHQFVALEAAKKLKRPLSQLNLITCHLGSGCSITAIKKGEAIDTSMGFTPLEGLVMSTRSGSIDPAIPLYIMRRFKMTAEEVDDLLNKRSGIFGLSGSMDMRELLVKAGYQVSGFEFKGKISERDRQIAKLTLEIFIYNIKKYIGAYSLILQQVDALVFTAGIGERSSIVRKLILKNLGDYKSIVVPANEELMIAQEARKFV